MSLQNAEACFEGSNGYKTGMVQNICRCLSPCCYTAPSYRTRGPTSQTPEITKTPDTDNAIKSCRLLPSSYCPLHPRRRCPLSAASCLHAAPPLCHPFASSPPCHYDPAAPQASASSPLPRRPCPRQAAAGITHAADFHSTVAKPRAQAECGGCNLNFFCSNLRHSANRSRCRLLQAEV
jgi:hypothetical protein